MEGGAQVSSTPQQGAGGGAGAGGVVEEQAAKCPRCESTNTKFCYYNNYNLSQPRHFCKSCRRYWTKGGALRNVPIGGGSRKNNSKRTSPANNSSSSKRPSPISTEVPEHADSIFQPVLNIPEHHQMLDISGSFSSLLGSSTQLGSLMDFDDHHQPGGDDLGLSLECQQQQQQQSSTDSSGNENFLSLQGTDWANGWPDLAIYTSPGNGFQ